MSEAIQKLRRNLSQAQKFSDDTPLEAVARAKLVRAEAQALLNSAKGEERSEVESIAHIAEARIKRYEAELARWDAEVRARANQFVQNEQDRIGHPIPPKV